MSFNKRKIHFEISERKILLRIIDVAVVLAALYFAGQIFDFDYFKITSDNFLSIVLLCFYITIFGTIFDMYHLPATINPLRITQGVLLTTSFSSLFFFLTPFFTPYLPQNRMQIVYFYLAVLISLMLWRFFYMKFLTSSRFVKKTVLICRKEQFYQLREAIQKADPNHRIVGILDTENEDLSDITDNEVTILKNIDELEEFMFSNGIRELMISPDSDIRKMHAKLLQLIENGIFIKDYLYAYEQLFNKVPIDLIEKDFYRYFPFSRSNHNKLYLFAVRAGEVVFSVVGLIGMILLLPFILIINAVGNKGPLFYTQERIGRNGRPFSIIKFRSMVKDAEKNGAVFAQKNDMRITPFGRFLRKTRIDEVPQLLNVLKGEMSVIGPRPERAYFVEQITEKMPFYPARHAIKPGLTGWAQINYKYGDSIEDSIEKLKYDLFYIKRRSVFLDINIVVKTIGTVLFYRGQ
ncbi:MAG: sugar transferase [Flavobacteriaceae bacterium]